MIYLFNSAFRPEYRTNILNTLYLPTGCINEYRYSMRHADPIFSQEQQARIFKRKKVKRGEKVTVVYIDRHGTSGFVFHPIRRGKLESIHFDNNQIYFRVRLLDYIYPKDVNEFQDVLQNTIGTDKLPRIKDNNPDIIADGFYALQSEDTLNTRNALSDNEAWVDSVEAIAKTTAFGRPTVGKIVFLRIKLTKEGGNTSLKPSMKNDDVFILKRNKGYQLTFVYRFPYQDDEPNAVSNIEVCIGNELIAKSLLQIPIEGRNNRKLLSVKVKKSAKELFGNINLNYSDSANDDQSQELLGPNSEIKYEIKESLCFWPMIILLLVIFSLCTVIIGLDFSKLIPSQPASGAKSTLAELIISIITLQYFWFKFIAGFIQFVIIFVLFRFTGKKFP